MSYFYGRPCFVYGPFRPRGQVRGWMMHFANKPPRCQEIVSFGGCFWLGRLRLLLLLNCLPACMKASKTNHLLEFWGWQGRVSRYWQLNFHLMKELCMRSKPTALQGLSLNLGWVGRLVYLLANQPPMSLQKGRKEVRRRCWGSFMFFSCVCTRHKQSQRPAK